MWGRDEGLRNLTDIGRVVHQANVRALAAARVQLVTLPGDIGGESFQVFSI